MTIWRDFWHRAHRGLDAPLTAKVTGTRRGEIAFERLEDTHSRFLKARRTVDVFLPIGYYGPGTERYPVLYLNDGQDSESLDLAAALERSQQEGSAVPIVVVAIHATGDRIREYGTAGVPNAQGYGDRASQYEQFILTELMPFIQSRYRVLTGPPATAIAGLSLGGLSAFDMAWRNPDRFGAVGVMSGSFWWRTNDRSPEMKQVSRIMHRRVRETPGRPALRMWLETGVRDETADRDGDGVIDSIQDTEELVEEILRKGYQAGRDVIHVTMPGGHDLPTWRGALPGMLRWLYGRAEAVQLGARWLSSS
jgi:enterochelin esterase-like enzyme